MTHKITNNPNDQIRPEDLENEGATGRQPRYMIDADGKYVSLEDCYEGDGDLIPGDEGEFEPEEIPAGTVLKQTLPLQGDKDSIPNTPSEDLSKLYTNAWYTTIDRDPFEWSYLPLDRDPNVFDFIGREIPDVNAELELVSGPRWRLKSNKFGQDIPGTSYSELVCLLSSCMLMWLLSGCITQALTSLVLSVVLLRSSLITSSTVLVKLQQHASIF